MSIRLRGSSSSNLQEVGSDGAARVTSLGPDIGTTGGRFFHSCKTGATTAIAALDGTNGIHWACRFAPSVSTKLCLVERLYAQYTSTVGPSVAQETGIAVFRATGFSAIPTSGTAATLTTPNAKLRVSGNVPELLISFENTTSEMTAGTHTVDTLPLAQRTKWHLAAAATVQMPDVELDLNLLSSPLVLAANEGLLLGPAVTQANSLAQVLRVWLQWREVASYPQ